MMENASISLYQIQNSFGFFVPEIVLSLTFIIIIVGGLLFRSQQTVLIPVIFFTGLSLTVIFDYQQLALLPAVNLFSGMVALDLKILYFKFVFAACGFITLGFSLLHKQMKNYPEQYLEYFAFITAVILGSHLVVMSANLLMVFLSLEIISVGSYLLVAFIVSRKTREASMKYILFGMFSSGIMLYGISFLFGFTGTLHFTSPEFSHNLSLIHPLPVLWATGLTLAGILFKISAFPFYLWAPDVYESAPPPIVAFFSTATKIAGFGLLVNFAGVLGHYDFSEYLPGFSLPTLTGMIALLTIIAGNFPALLQKNAKRMLGYSAIAQSGFMLLPFVSHNGVSMDAMLFYVTMYAVMSFAAFFMIDKMSESTGSDLIQDYKGLGLQNPFWGIMMIIVMVSLTGLPPTAGFIAKLLIFSDLWESYLYQKELFLLILFMFGLINSVVALFYYLKIPFFMFLRKNDVAMKMPLGFADYLFAGSLTALLLFFFFKADMLTNFIHHYLSGF